VRVLSVVHERDAGSGVFGLAAAARGDELHEWIPAEREAPSLEGFDAVLVFGGGMDVDQEDEHRWLPAEKDYLRALLERRTPALGVCLGAQLLAEVAGGSVQRAAQPEIGWAEVTLDLQAAADPVLGGLPSRFEAFEWHSCEFALPADAVALASSSVCLQAFRLESAPWWGIQFHAEVTAETVEGWLRDYGRGEDAARAGLDRDAVWEQTRHAIAGWNLLGTDLCRHFLDNVAASEA
jgi:GMP synthase-like glutamine amidotransferase